MKKRQYDQFCPVACALDVVGERWAMLVVRELLAGPKRFVDLEAGTLTHRGTGAVHHLRPLGDAGPVIAAGGLFAYARQSGMIAAPPPVSPTVDGGPTAGPDD